MTRPTTPSQLVGALAALSCAACGSDEPQQKPPRFMLFAVDGLDSTHFLELHEQGQIPTMSRLATQGLVSEIRSIQPLVSPAIWTTVASGKAPSQHGVLDWMVSDGKGGERVVSANEVKVRRLWEILDEKGVRSVVTGWLASFPPLPTTGLNVSTRAIWSEPVGVRSRNEGPLSTADLDDLQGAVMPPDALGWVMGLMPTREEVEDGPFAYQVQHVDLPVHPWARDEFAVRVTAEGMRRYEPEVAITYFKGLDELSHMFWSFKNPAYIEQLKGNYSSYAEASREVGNGVKLPWAGQAMTDERLAIGRRVVDDYLVWIDQAIGRLLEEAGGNPDVIVVSDHGFVSLIPRTDTRNELQRPANEHRSIATVIMSGPSFQPGAGLTNPSLLDITPTVLHTLGWPVARDMKGRVLSEAMASPTEVQWVDTYETSPLLRVEVAATDEGKELERLRALGYIE